MGNLHQVDLEERLWLAMAAEDLAAEDDLRRKEQLRSKKDKLVCDMAASGREDRRTQ